MLANLKTEIGSLAKVKQVIKVTGFIALTTGFTNLGEVLSTALDLLMDIFSERGKYSRSAVSAPVMAKNTPVKIEMIVALDM